jgi:hypothetical protein
MIDILEKIPVSGSFERAKLTQQVSHLMDQYNALTAGQLTSDALVSTSGKDSTDK